MNIKEDLRKRIISKIEEGYNEGGRLVEMGEVALYPEPAPAVDPTVQGSGKTLQVDSDLLRDLLNWATSADAGSIDAVVAKAEEMGISSPLTPAQLVDLTATAHTADPSNPTVGGQSCDVGSTPAETSPVIPSGPVGPLSPVMASFVRRGKKIEELSNLARMDKSGAVQVKTAQKPGQSAPMSPKDVARITRAEQKAKAAGISPEEMTLLGNEGEEKVCEDDIIDSDNEVITKPEQMGNKNPGINADGGQNLPDTTTRPIGKLNDPANMGGKGLAEDGVEDEAGEIVGGVEDAAAAIADGIADGITGDVVGTEPEVTAIPDGGIPQNDDAAVNAQTDAPVAPPVGDDGGDGLVGQVAALNARVAELEALLSGSATSEIEVGSDDAPETDDLSIDKDEDEDEDEDAEDTEDAEEDGEEDKEENNDESGEEDEEDKEDDDDKDDGDKKILLGDKGKEK